MTDKITLSAGMKTITREEFNTIEEQKVKGQNGSEKSIFIMKEDDGEHTLELTELQYQFLKSIFKAGNSQVSLDENNLITDDTRLAVQIENSQFKKIKNNNSQNINSNNTQSPIKQPEKTTCVTYTITVTKGGNSESITLSSIVPGMYINR